MEFLKRKHFSLLTITMWWITLLLASLADFGNGLQGVPTWMCLGIKSPFIEFKAEIEILANTSVSLNITKDDQALMHQQGLQNLGGFIKPVDLRNSTTSYVKSNLTKKITYSSNRKKGVTEHPITEEMNRKEPELIEEEMDPNSYNNDDQKYIIPMALKNPSNEPKRKTTTTSPSPPPQSTPTDFSTNIDDLKNHILMLQNLTKNDKNFQSKFVVFPSLQRERTQNKNETIAPQHSRQSKKAHSKPPKGFDSPIFKPDDFRDNSDDEFHKEKITIVPQVLLLNDQTPPDEEDTDRNRNDDRKEIRITYSRRKNFRKTTTITTTSTTTITPSTIRPSRRTPKRQRTGGGGGRNKNKQRQQNCKNIDSPKCQRQRRRQMAALTIQNTTKTPSVGSISKDFFSDNLNKTNHRQDNVDPFWSEGSIRSTNIGGSNNVGSSNNTGNNRQDDDLKLSRSVRSHHSRRNAGGMKSGNNGLQNDGGTRDFIIPVGNVINNNQSMAYKENIDLNPDLCYKVGGLTYGQQKLCVLHTSIMPAISRGARSAIQECKHQFKNRRWNCSTTEDNTVFGPMSSIGSPEMAFIHALAAATVTSFIARACRDGQLASCGCSRSPRPKQLHDDWTWGGCGDDLEYAYKFSQNFIDIREKERKRGTRGLVSVPQKNKLEEKLLAESSAGLGPANGDTNDGIVKHSNNGTTESINLENRNSSQQKDDNPNLFKQEDLLELQEKITKEILNSKLQEKEMLELQEKINREILNSKVFNLEHHSTIYNGRKQHQRSPGGGGGSSTSTLSRMKNGVQAKARSLMNLHNNEAGRRAVLKASRITCKCHGVSGSCSLITCWQQLSSIREIGDFLREKYDEATEVKLNKKGRLTVKDPRYKVPTAHDLVYLDESPDWCRYSRQLQWPGTHGRVCNKTSSGLDGCAILCCGRGYNTKNIVVRERCNCKFHWCCQVKCEICVKVLEEHTCK